jgi:2-aminoadipate transaminase
MDRRIDRLQRIGAARPGTILLSGGLPAAELFPKQALARSFLTVLDQPNRTNGLQYGWPEGDLALRSWIASRLRRRGAVHVQSDDVIITSGAQQAIDLAARVLYRPGDRVGVDAESYPAALDLFRSRGLQLAAADERVAGFYCMPSVSNPRGLEFGPAARQCILNRLETGDVSAIEDDAYAELRFDGTETRPLCADAPDGVLHVGTFSKVLCPGLRVGWLVPPRRLFQEMLAAKQEADLQAGGLAQAVLEHYLRTNDYDAHVAAARDFYAGRADALVTALRKELPQASFCEPQGSFAVFVETDLCGDDIDLLSVSLAHGVSFDPGRAFRREGRASPLSMRLAFACEPAERIAEGVARLAAAFRAYVHRSGDRAQTAT